MSEQSAGRKRHSHERAVRTPPGKRVSRVFVVLRDATEGFIDHRDLTLAASIAYYTALSLAPLLVLGLWLVASISPGAQNEFVEQIGVLGGSEARAATQLIVDNASANPSIGSLAGIVGIVLLILSATAVFSQLQTALNAIWQVDVKAGQQPISLVWDWVRRRLLSIGILAAIVFVLIVSLIVDAVLGMVFRHAGAVWEVVNQFAALVIFALLFAALFKFLPDARLSWRDTWLGAALTSVLFAAGKYAIGAYTANSGFAGAYGPAGSLAVLLVWVYYSATIFLFGAEIVQVMLLSRRGARKPQPYAKSD
jgi:membrane protein